MLYYTLYPSPLGSLTLVSDGRSLLGLYTKAEQADPPVAADWQRDDQVEPFGLVREQLATYFAGEAIAFTVPLQLQGTAFQQRVWQALQAIPHGTTISYGELARRIGQPTAARAVGLANRGNPVSIIVPCHRVIGANGDLTGYAGGLERKRWLLTHEGAIAATPNPLSA